MTQSPTGSTSASPVHGESVPSVARDEAADVAQHAGSAAGHVAQVGAEQAKEVVAETARQAKDFVGEGMEQLQQQAREGQQRAAQGLRSLAGQLNEMCSSTTESGVAADVVRQGASRAEGFASWLEGRNPGDLVEEVRRFGRERPGTFLLGAAVAGLAVGRLTRGLLDDRSEAGRNAERPAAPHPVPEPVDVPRQGAYREPPLGAGYNEPVPPSGGFYGSAPPAAGMPGPSGTAAPGVPPAGYPPPAYPAEGQGLQ